MKITRIAALIAASGTIALTGGTASADAHQYSGKLPHWHYAGKSCHKHSKAVWHKGQGKIRKHCRTPKRQRAAARVGGGGGGYVLPAYIVKCESGGNWRAVNHSNPNRPAGAYQIITSTWRAYGGGQFAPTADLASPREQGIIALRVLRGQGIGAWSCA